MYIYIYLVECSPNDDNVPCTSRERQTTWPMGSDGLARHMNIYIYIFIYVYTQTSCRYYCAFLRFAPGPRAADAVTASGDLPWAAHADNNNKSLYIYIYLYTHENTCMCAHICW